MLKQNNQINLSSATHPDIVECISVQRVASSVAMLLVGIGLFLFILRLDDKSSAVSMLSMVAGTVLVLFGIFRLFWHSKVDVYRPTNSMLKRISLFFELKNLESLTAMIEQGNPELGAGVQSCGSGNVRMDVILSKDHRFAAVQLFQFVPYTYSPVTSVRYFSGADAEALSRVLSGYGAV